MSFEQRRKLLIKLLVDPDKDVRDAAAKALERFESYLDLDQIITELKAEKRGQRVRAIYAMEYVQSPDVFPHLINLLKDPDADLRSAAVQVLGVKAHPKSLSSLVKHLKDPSPAVRVHTAEALGYFQDSRLIPLLSSLLQSDDEQLVISAALSLGKQALPEAQAPLLALLEDSRPSVRVAAIEALTHIPV
mgnify:CR=1 FL=1